MSTEIAVVEQKALTAEQVRAHVNLVQKVMQAVMQKETHYGVIPGSKKPSLYKPGAEVLCATFRIAPSYRTEDLSNGDSIRYRITAIGTHQMTGVVLGEGIGECSSNEEKYKWRASICDEEFEGTPPDRRRIKFAKWNNKVEKKQQVRTEPADIANTVLKMAAKRAQVAMTLNVTAASDCFAQDIEDLPEHLRDTDVVPDPIPEFYSAEGFNKNLPAWKSLIESGKKTADDIIKTVQSKAKMTDEQMASLKAFKKQESTAIHGEVMTEEEIQAAQARELEESAK